jgi:hypothetical protein
VLSADAREFIAKRVKSLWALALLLLLHRKPDRVWTVDGLTAELRASEGIIAESVDIFRGGGLIADEPEGRLRYRPHPVVAEIASAYASTPFAVTREVFASASDRIRTFADAFRIKKD